MSEAPFDRRALPPLLSGVCMRREHEQCDEPSCDCECHHDRTARRHEIGQRVRFTWLGAERVGIVANVQHARGGRTWLWIEIEHQGRRLRLGYEPHEVSDA